MSEPAAPPRNRRERRAAAAKKSGKSTTTPSARNADEDIPMVRPDYDAKPSEKTLLEIAEERRAELMDKAAARQSELDKASGKTRRPLPPKDTGDEASAADADDVELGAFATSVLYTISLSAIHLTLDVLVLTQYQQDLVWAEIFGRLAKLTPALLLVVWLAHTDQAKSLNVIRQLIFLAASIAAGCFIIRAGNKDGYYLVMKQAPPVGTLWVWSVFEMDVIWSVIHVAVVGSWMWYNGYGAF